MSVFHADGQATFYQGDVIERLREMPENSVHTCVTSPPYWGLRDYGVEGQLGLEATPEEFIEKMVAVFREVRRVLREDGTLWLNIGDSYAGYHGNKNSEIPTSSTNGWTNGYNENKRGGARPQDIGLKPKDLIGIPWMLAFALRADGWYLRQDIIWSKPNPMPESVTDRCTKAHEMVFLLTKSARYFFDADAIRERVSEAGVIETPNLNGQPLVLSQHLGQKKPPANHALRPPLIMGSDGRGSLERGIRLATAILDLSQREDKFGLPLFDPQVGHQGGGDRASTWPVGDPIVRRATAQAARFADGDIAAKEFLGKVDRLCVALPDGHDLKELWVHPSALIDSDGDASVAVNNAGEVGQIQFVHNQDYTTNRGPSYSGRNKRSVWTIATEAFSARALGGGTTGIRSADCPVHGDSPLAAQARQAARRDAQRDAAAPGSDGTGNHPAPLPPLEQSSNGATRSDSDYQPETQPERIEGSTPSRKTLASLPRGGDPLAGDQTPTSTERTSVECVAQVGSSDSGDQSRVASAKGRSSENHKTGHAPETIQPYTASAQNEPSTPRMSELPGFFDSAAHTSVSSTAPADSDGHPSAQTQSRTAGKLSCSCIVPDHFATFPTALVKPCILAGTSERGVCSQCGAPWLREVEKSEPVTRVVNDARVANGLPKQGNLATKRWDEAPVITTLGWAPSCKHEAPAIPATVLDPFLGSGTTAYVAKSLGRHAVGIDLNPEYLELARRRCAQMGLMS